MENRSWKASGKVLPVFPAGVDSLAVGHATDASYIGDMMVTTFEAVWDAIYFQKLLATRPIKVSISSAWMLPSLSSLALVEGWDLADANGSRNEAAVGCFNASPMTLMNLSVERTVA